MLDGGVAEDAGVAGFDEYGAFCGGNKVWGEADGAESISGAVAWTEEGRSGFGHQVIIVGRRFPELGLVPLWEKFSFGAHGSFIGFV
jgi:hypothetical protein